VSTRVDVEEIQTTKSEKLLAAVLALFLLIGGVWTYEKIDDYAADAVAIDFSFRGDGDQQAVLDRADEARQRYDRARTARINAREDLVLTREEYRTALEAGAPAARLAEEYERAQRRFARGETQLAAAQGSVARAERAADDVRSDIAAEVEDRQDRRALLSFLLRFALVVVSAGLGFWLLARLRRVGSRYFPVAIAVVVYAAVLAFVLAADYVTDYVDPFDLGPLFLSLFGIAATLLAFLVLERYLARRVPFRRARKSECPYCGYPVRGNRFCEGCGRDVVAPCAQCGKDRRVGTARCGLCGSV
jgi:hypothetical protein